MMIANPETMRVESVLRSAAWGRKGWLCGTALAGRIGALAAGAGAAVVALPGSAAANPTGGQVVAGAAEIVTVSPTQLDILQSSGKAIINWGDFSIQPQESTNFLQPGRNSWTLNRVTGGDPSQILGTLTANGNVIVLNQNGVLFGPNSRIDVGGLIASTANIADTDFLADQFRFEGAPQGSTVVNQGRITVAEGGLAALVAPGVANSGVIEARLGRVSLAAGTAFTVDLYGDGLVSLALGGAVTEAPVGADGSKLAALVANDGRILVEGGRVLLTAEAAKGVVDSVINMKGVIEARSVGRDGTGAIVLGGGESGAVSVSGTLDASGAESGEVGGRIEVTGELVHLEAGARLDASGAAGGGTILVGGDFQGGGETPTARRTFVEHGATLSADATQAGDGGRVIVWAEEATAFYGHVSATGGALGGDGGFAEISGREGLAYSGSVDLTAPAGAVGTVLFDPRNVFFMNGGTAVLAANPFLFSDMPNTDFTFDADAVNNANANTVVQANQNIVFDENITTGDAFSYTFQAGQGIVLNTNITTNGGAVTLIANDPGLVASMPDPAVTQVGITGSGNIITNGGAIELTVSTGANPGAVTLAGMLDSSNATVMGGDILVRNQSGTGEVTLGAVLALGGGGGVLTLDAPTVRLTGDLRFGSVGMPMTAPASVAVATTASIQDAIDIAAAGALITLDAGTFSERGIRIDKHVGIMGAGTDPITGSLINADPAVMGFLGRGSGTDGIILNEGGVDSMNTLLLQGFAVANASGTGIVLNPGFANTIGFINLVNLASTMNDDGLSIIGGGAVHDLLLDGVALNFNGDDGLFIDLGTVRRLGIFDSMIAANGQDGIIAVNATLSDITIGAGTVINRNFGSGVHLFGGTVMPEASVMGSFGILVDESQIVSNRMNGVLIDNAATVHDLTIQSSTIAGNGAAPSLLDGNGIFIHSSTVSDLVVTDSAIGAVDMLMGNDGDGIRAEFADLSGVLIRDSAIDGNLGNGIHVVDGRTIRGVTVDSTTIVGNAFSGILIEGGAVVTDMTILASLIADNGTAAGALNGDGITIRNSTVTDLVVDDSDIGADGVVPGNDGDGIRTEGATLSGILIRDSAIDGNLGNGIHIVGGQIMTGPAIMMNQTVMTGLTVDPTTIIGNAFSGILIEGGAVVTDMTILASVIADNGTAAGALNGDGITIRDSTVTNLVVDNSVIGVFPGFAGNDGDGIRAEQSDLSEVQIRNGSRIDGNLGNGIHVIGGTVMPEAGVTGNTGLTIDASFIRMNMLNGVLIEMGAMVRDMTIHDALISANGQNGIAVIDSAVDDLTLDAASISSNGVDGMRFQDAMATDLAIIGGIFAGLLDNGGSGLHVIGGTIMDGADADQVAVTLDSLDVSRNGRGVGGSGVLIDQMAVIGGLTMVGGMLAQNRDHGFSVENSRIDDLAFTAVDFRANGFDALGMNGNGGDGIHAEGATITDLVIAGGNLGTPTLLRDNSGSGAEIRDSTVTGATINAAILTQNGADGLTLADSTISDLAIADSAFGRRVDMIFNFMGNAGSGVAVTGGGVDGLVITNSSFEGNGTGGAGSGFRTDMAAILFGPGGIANSSFSINRDHGFAVIGGSLAGAAIQNTTFDDNGFAPGMMANGGDGFHGNNAAITGLTFMTASLSRNGGDGISIDGGSLDGLVLEEGQARNNRRGGVVVTSDLSGVYRFEETDIVDNIINGGVALADSDPVSALTSVEFSMTNVDQNGGDGAQLDGLVADSISITDSSFQRNQGSGFRIVDGVAGNGTGVGLVIADTLFTNNGLGGMGSGFQSQGGAVINGLNASGTTEFNLNREHGVSLISATLNDAVFSGASFNNNGFGGPAGNGGDGVHIETSMVDGLAIVNNGVATSLSSNQGSGVEITDSTVSDLAIGGAEVIGNLADGILAQGMTTLNNLQVTNSRIDNNLGSGANLMDVVLNGALFADSSFDFNEGHGFAVIGGTFNDATFINGSLFFNGMPMGGDGFHGEDAAISNLTFDSIGDAFPSVNQNNGTGISIVGGGLDGLIIRNADVLGNQGAGLLADTDLQGDIRIGSETTFDRFIGNLGGAGVDLTDRDTMTAVGTLSIEATVSTFNAGEGVVLRGLAVDTLMLTDVGFNDNMGDGLSIINGAFTTAAITGATIFSNAGNGIAADGAMFGNGGPAAMGFALHASQIVGNAGNGVAFENVNASGVTIMDTDVAVNGVNGVYVDGGTLAGFAIRNSHLGEILDTMGMVEFIGNFGNGLLISNAAIDDLVIDGGTMVVRNGVNGIAISASGLGMTDGSILFGITTITDNMTGILVNNANAQAPLLITFGPTTINGGVDGLFLSGAGIGLTGGGSIPGGSPVGGGVMPGDNLFGGSLGNLAFNGQTGTFVTLMNGALFDPGMPTVIDASNVTFDGTPADMLDDMERQDVMDRIIDFNDDMTVGLIFLPPPPVMMVPSPAENPGLIDELPGKENTPGDTLFRLTDGIEFNPDPGQPNAFCFGYSLADGQAPGGVEGEDEAVVCADLPSTPAPVNPNQGLGNFWQGWQAARR